MAQYEKTLIYIFQQFSASVKKVLGLEGRVLSRSETRGTTGIYHVYY